ncbi:MAG: RNA polymerase sigma factor [Candidatus Azobacteroides sp.]|nr:RNA polymerase sigma factor [Candidatus Azobacteroides sp.]
MEQEQFKREILPLRGKLTFYAQQLLGNESEAEDVIQEVFLKLWYMREDLKNYHNIPALSYKMTKHLCLNLLKGSQRKNEELNESILVYETLSPESQLEQKDEVERVMLIIDQLPDLQKTMLRMKHVDGFEIDEIAGITGSTPEAVRMNLSRARKKVRELFFRKKIY